MQLVIELIREFYNTQRWFRIIPDQVGADAQFVNYDNSRIKGVEQPSVNGMDVGYRVPEFDIEITAEKANPYRRMEQNELALSFYKLGFFNPQASDQAMACLKMMDFDEKDDVMETVRNNGILLEKLMMFQNIAVALAQRYKDEQALMLIQQNMGAVGADLRSSDIDPKEAASPGTNTGGLRQVEKARARTRSSTEVS